MARQKATVKEFAPIWNKKGALSEGDSLEGFYKSLETITTKLGELYLLTIVDKEGNETAVAATADIRRKIASVPPKSYVWITYKGIQETEKGNSMKVYDIDFDPEVVLQ